MERFVIRQNISHFEDLLKRALDDKRRATIESLLREERAKLSALDAQTGPPRHGKSDHYTDPDRRADPGGRADPRGRADKDIEED